MTNPLARPPQVAVIPDYNVSVAGGFIPGAELTQQISTAGPHPGWWGV